MSFFWTTNPQTPIKIRKTGIQDVLSAVLRGNKRSEVNKGSFQSYPTSASEGNNPQKVKKNGG